MCRLAHREAGAALDEGADRRPVQSDGQVALPMARHSAVFGLWGRWEIMISGAMNFLPRPRVRARGIRRARLVRKQATSSRLRVPRPWMYSAW